MKKILILFALLFISQVSADITLTPNTFNIDGFPGETIAKTITIQTSGNYAVYLNVSCDSSISVNYSSPIIVEKSKDIEINFTFAKDIVPGIYPINITALTEYPIEVITYTSGSSGGGGSSVAYVLPNGSITYKKPNNFTEPVKIIYINQTQEKEVQVPVEAKEKWWFWLLFPLCIGFGITCGYLIFKFAKRKDEN